MVIVITTKEPRPDWNGLNVKRITDAMSINCYRNGEPPLSIITKEGWNHPVTREEIANIVITY